MITCYFVPINYIGSYIPSKIVAKYGPKVAKNGTSTLHVGKQKMYSSKNSSKNDWEMKLMAKVMAHHVFIT